MKGNKILATIIAVAMVLSAMVVLNVTTDFKLVENASATGEVTKAGATTGLELTCGELITFKVVDNSLTYDESYTLAVWNGTAWIPMVTETADYHGDIEIEFHVPWWDLLGMNPLTNNGGGGLAFGEWNVRLFNTSTASEMDATTQQSDNVTLTIRNMYHVTFTEGEEEIDYMTFNKSYDVSTNNKFGVTVKNFTGTTYPGSWDTDFSDTSDEDFDYHLFLPNAIEITSWAATDKSNTWQYSLLPGVDGSGYRDGSNYETFYWVNVSVNGVDWQYSNISIPCKLNITEHTTIPSSITWGDSGIDFDLRLMDGEDNDIDNAAGYADYTMATYAPTNGSWVQADTSTFSNGYYSVYDLDTTTYSAGTWYIGTLVAGTYRISIGEPDKPSGLPANFIPYMTFDVATYEGIDIDFRNSDEVISGFNQTINISVDNETLSKDAYWNLGPENFHITGLKAWNSTNNEEFDDDDIVCLADFGGNSFTRTRNTTSRAYYEFTYRFNQTGTAMVYVSYPSNITHIQNADGIYSDTYNNENLLANWTSSTSFDVSSPGNLNMIVRGTMPSTVNVVAGGDTSPGQAYVNSSQSFYIDFFGSDNSERVNATLQVSGCGIDFTIEQNDTVAENPYLLDKGNGWYQVKLEPKTGGTLSLTATNGSDSDTADFSFDGLAGSVTTSDGDDLAISVTTQETITVTVTSKAPGLYPIETATVYLTLFDEDWNEVESLNNSAVDDLTGTDGIYQFYPALSKLSEVGFIVCAASSGGLWMYDVIEIEPMHDINVTILTPEPANQTLTVGIDNQVLELQLRDAYGDILEGSAGGNPTVTGYLLDDDHPTKEDPKQTLEFKNSGSGSNDKWSLDDSAARNFPFWAGTLYIEVVNNTGEDEHDGSVSIPVEHATVTFAPDSAVAGIGKANVTGTLTCLLANGNPCPEGTDVFLNLNPLATMNTTFDTGDNQVELDENGQAEFNILKVGTIKGEINATFVDFYDPTWGGNVTSGAFIIDYPLFDISPSTISTEVNSATVMVTATDFEGNALSGINLTFTSLGAGNCIEMPDPEVTDENGQASFDITPLSSGKANITIIAGLGWTTTSWTSTDIVYTDDVLTIRRQVLDVEVSPSSVYAGSDFTVTVTDEGTPVEDADVKYQGTTIATDANGEATFTATDPGIDSDDHPIKVTKDGYPTVNTDVLVINVYDIAISAGASATGGNSFTVTVVANKAALAGATVTFNGEEVITDGEGKATFTAPSVSKNTEYTITATYDDPQYIDASYTITVKPGGTPGFELLTLIAAIGVAFILLRRRRKK